MRFPRVPKHIFPSGRRPSAPNHAHPPLPGSPPPGVPITPLSCNSNQLPPPSYDIAIAESPIASSSTSPPLPPSSISLSRDDKNLNNLGLASTPDTAVLALDVVPVLTNTEPPSENMLVLLREDYQSVRSVIAKLTWRQCCRNLIAKWLWKWYAIFGIAIALTVLISVNHEAIVHFCHPISKQIRSWPAGWLIPTAVLVILSFPPLVGHEIVGILCGLVWGIGPGFAILAAGTFIGEIALWMAFKWCCQARAKKFEKENNLYASLAQLIREKSFMFILILRFSAIPGHITTAVSASAGANFWSYLAAAFLTLPKQFSIIYVGAAFGTKTRSNSIISTCMLVITIAGTAVAAAYIYYQMRVVMRRRGVMLPCTTADLPPSGPTWQDLANEQNGVNGAAGVNRRTSTYTGIQMAELAKVDADEDGEKPPPGSQNESSRPLSAAALHARRPWLFTANSYSSNSSKAPLRAWSMPGHLSEDELREWRAELQSGMNTPAIRISEENPPLFNDSFSPPSSLRGLATPSVLTISTDVDPASTSNLPSPIDDAPPRSPVASYASRRSLDYERPPVSLGRSDRGGREIADEADQYAISHGVRRPDLHRLRGESRAALLGRPDSPSGSRSSTPRGVSEEGSPRWSRTGKERAREKEVVGYDSNLLGSGDHSRRDSAFKRDYQRSRGESGAALMGRPDAEELGIDRGVGSSSSSKAQE